MKKAAKNKKKDTSPIKIEDKPKIVAEIEPSVNNRSGMKNLFSNKPLLVGGIIVLLIIIAAGVIYAVSYYAPDATVTSNQSAKDVQNLLKDLGKIYEMPKDETPTVATVTDIKKLSGQPFFKNAKDGDKVILFGGIKEAILFRSSTKKIINMTSINPNSIPTVENKTSSSSAKTTTSTTPAPGKKIKVAVLNSTKEAGLAKKAGGLLDDKEFDVVTESNANGEYDKTTVSVAGESKVSDADLSAIASQLSKVTVKKSVLPNDEAAPAGADVVIILGKDFSEAY